MRFRAASAAVLAGGLSLTPLAPSLTPGALAQETDDHVLGKRSTITFDQPSESIPVRAGSRIHDEAADDAPVLATVAADAELQVVRREGDWAEVRYRSWQGWVFTGVTGKRKSLLDRPGWRVETTEDGSRRFVVAPEPTPEFTEARLLRLREVLGDGERELQFGAFRVLTDVRDDALFEQLRATIGTLEATYRSRFGLEIAPAEGEPQAIVLFAREETYRSYEDELPGISELATLGHQSHGVAVTFVGERSLDRIRRTLLHEVTHLLNRRALPLLLPSWLEEGLAEDISFCRVNEEGEVLPGTILGENERSLRGRHVSGGFASLAALLSHHRQPSWPKVADLVAADWEEFVQPELRPTHYTQAAFFIRFMLDGRDGLLAEGFRSYLQTVAGGGADRADLWSHLGLPEKEVEGAYDAWILSQAVAYGVVSQVR